MIEAAPEWLWWWVLGLVGGAMIASAYWLRRLGKAERKNLRLLVHLRMLTLGFESALDTIEEEGETERFESVFRDRVARVEERLEYFAHDETAARVLWGPEGEK